MYNHAVGQPNTGGCNSFNTKFAQSGMVSTGHGETITVSTGGIYYNGNFMQANGNSTMSVISGKRCEIV